MDAATKKFISFKDDYQPIENYAIIGDLQTIALIGVDGSIDFLCLPHFDSPSIFCALLDRRRGGFFQISSCQENVKRKQMYLPETNILLTRFLYEDGIGELTDFMPVIAFSKKSTLIRKVSTIKGKITYRMQCCPKFNYGQDEHKVKVTSESIIFFNEALALRLTSSVPIEIKHGELYAEFTLDAGQTAYFVLEHYEEGQAPLNSLNQFAGEAFTQTLNFWKEWVSKSSYDGRWREMVTRSALTLKLLISYQNGAMVAAPTFGLPEKIGGRKNWDYRFVWIRDAAFAIYTLLSIGYTAEAEAFMKWMQGLVEKGNLTPFYRLDGTPAYQEKMLHFEGYKKSAPVTIGNDAKDQLQLDIYGEFIDAVYLCDKYVAPISHEMWKYLADQIRWLLKNWHRKDCSIWEVRGETEEFLYSRLMCWVAVDRAIKIGIAHSFPFPNYWVRARNDIFRSIYRDFWQPKLKCFTQYKGSLEVDGSSLLMPLRRFVSPKDPDWLMSLKFLEQHLATDCMVYRYDPAESKQFGVGKGEGTFSACSFWYIECLSRSGQLEKAEAYFDKMLCYSNHVGLFGEQLGFTGEHLGNFPQAFTHLSLISAAYNLNKQLNRRAKGTWSMELPSYPP